MSGREPGAGLDDGAAAGTGPGCGPSIGPSIGPDSVPAAAVAPHPADRRRWGSPQGALWLALAYAALAGLSILLSRQPGSIAMVWFANALAVVALARAPQPQWLVLVLAVVVANLAINRWWGDGWPTALALLAANMLEIAIAAWALRRVGLMDSGLRTPSAVLRLLLQCAVLPAALGSLLAGALLAPLWRGPGWAAMVDIAQNWFLGAGIGAVSALPLALLLCNQPRVRLRQALLSLRVLLLLVLAVAVTLLCVARLPFPFVMLAVPLLAAALLVEVEAVALLTLVVAVTVSLALATGIFEPLRLAMVQPGSVYLALVAALVPPLLLAATVADMRDSQQRLRDGQAALRLANDGLQQFVHMASHDLREPINTIEQFSGLIAQDHGLALPAPAQGYLALVQQEAGRLRALLDDVLVYSQVQQGELPAAQPVALDAVLAQVQQALAERMRASGAQVQVAPLPVVTGHAALLVLLLHSLLDNALKFVPPGQAPVVQVSASVGDGQVWLSVSDRGIGIAADQQARLFLPFQRLHRRRDYGGTGLGLALCRQIARVHGGEISLRSAPGQGSTFTVRLPI